MATVIIPTPLRKFTNNTARLQVGAGTIHSPVEELTRNFPDLKKHLLDEGGKIRSYVNIFIGNDDIRDLQQEKTPVTADTVISIVPAIAGGTEDPALTNHSNTPLPPISPTPPPPRPPHPPPPPPSKKKNPPAKTATSSSPASAWKRSKN